MKSLFLLVILTFLPIMAACSTSCDCPKCPNGNTTVVTPPTGGHSTIVSPGY